MIAPGAQASAWDLPTRLFHWALTVLVVFSYVTGKLGGEWMTWHMRSGYTILALIGFRLAWGFVGPAPARFASFLRGPATTLAYLRTLRAGNRPAPAGHNPLGGWNVVLMLALLLLQAGTGLFSNDESAHEGPLAAKVSDAMVDRMSAIHGWVQLVLVVVVALHVAAVLFYQLGLRIDVLRSMVGGAPTAPRTVALAAAFAAASAAVVYWLVVLYPKP